MTPLPLLFCEERRDEARRLAAHHSCFVLQEEVPGEGTLFAELVGAGLQLRQAGKGAPGALRVDFGDSALVYRLRHGGGVKEPIARAVGLRHNRRPRVLDATAGLGRDAFILAALGCEVWLLERNPVVAALLEDGLARATALPEIAQTVSRMQLLIGSAHTSLPDLAARITPEVVYLDPMFPERKKSALVKKEMRYFHTLVGPDADADSLLALSRQVATDRVVVKRPEHAEWLAQVKPDHAIKSKKMRFDVYLRHK